MFEALLGGDSLDARDDGEGGWEDMQWVRNRTVVVFGDSVARENVAYFCEVRLIPSRASSCSSTTNARLLRQLVGAKLDRITWDHRFAPSPRPTHTPPPLVNPQDGSAHFSTTPGDSDADPELVRDWTPKHGIGNGEQAHMAHVCHVPRWGLLLVQQFQYG